MSEVVTAHLTCPPLVMALDARLLRRIAESAFAAPDFPIRELHVAMHADGLDAPIPAVSDRKKVEHALQAAEAYRARCMSHDPQAEPRTIETLQLHYAQCACYILLHDFRTARSELELLAKALRPPRSGSPSTVTVRLNADVLGSLAWLCGCALNDHQAASRYYRWRSDTLAILSSSLKPPPT